MFLQLISSPFDLFQVTPVDLTGLFFLFIKILILLGFFLYILFAFLAVRQIEEMRQTVVTPLSSLIRVVGYVHLLLAIGAFLFAFSYLR
jgi:hypothetical protein